MFQFKMNEHGGILKVAGQRRKKEGRRKVTFKDSSLSEEEMEFESTSFSFKDSSLTEEEKLEGRAIFRFLLHQTENEKPLSELVGQPTFSDIVPENFGLVRGMDTGSTGSTESGEAAYGPNTNDSSTWMVSAASSSSCPVSELPTSSQLQIVLPAEKVWKKDEEGGWRQVLRIKDPEWVEKKVEIEKRRRRLIKAQLRDEAEAAQRILSVQAPTMIEQSSGEPEFKPTVSRDAPTFLGIDTNVTPVLSELVPWSEEIQNQKNKERTVEKEELEHKEQTYGTKVKQRCAVIERKLMQEDLKENRDEIKMEQKRQKLAETQKEAHCFWGSSYFSGHWH